MAAVEFDITLEENPVIDIDMGMLQFVGISDHSQLNNREAKDQHPISSVTGLEDELNELAKFDEKSFEKQKEYDNFILDAGKTMEAHSEAIKKLEDFKDNIATAETIKEVLENEQH